MRKNLYGISVVVMVLLGFFCAPFVYAQGSVDPRTVEMEKRRLQEKLRNCDNELANSPTSQENKERWRERCRKRMQGALDELAKDPDFYFYKKQK